jgi:hypothetical protein
MGVMKMNNAWNASRLWMLTLIGTLLSACNGGGGYGGGGSGGDNGLSGSIVLTDNSADALTLTTSGSFTFATTLATGATYNAAVKTQPANQTCSVANATGTIAAANITNITVTCTANPSVTANIVMPSTAAVGTPVSFDAGASTSSIGLPLTYTWDFGDGTRGGVAKLARAFAKAGNYQVTLTAMDSAGRSDSKTQMIAVTDVVTGPSVTMTMTVADLLEASLPGVSASVVNGTATATSDANGSLTLSVATDANVLIKLTKTGYADQFVPLNFPRGTGADAYLHAHMIARENAQTLADAAQGGTLIGKDGASLVVNANSLVDAAGHAVSGPLQVTMTPVNVTTAAINGFPGRFTGITPDANSTNIVSYDSVEFTLTQSGQRVQIAPGKTATIEIPSYPNTHADGTAVTIGSSVPLWSLDENSGLWTQEGVGTVVASTNSPTGLSLRAVVAHMSWWNMDKPIDGLFNPQPQCTDGTIGVPGDTNHLANETICNLLAQFDNSSGASAIANANDRKTALAQQSIATTSVPIKPGFGGTYTVPMAGGVAIRLPTNQAMLLSASAINGTWLGHLTVSGNAGARPVVTIPLFPVTAAPIDELITLPFDATRSLDAGKSSRLRFTTDGNKPVSIVFANGVSSNFTGRVQLLQGATVVATANFGASAVVLNSPVLPAGDYVIQIDNTGTVAATFSLQANYVHWTAPIPPIDSINRVLQMQLFYDSQGNVVLMDKEVYTPSTNTAVRNTRLVFRRLSGNAWLSAADTIELGLFQSGSNSSTVIGFALDRSDHPSYATANADMQSYSVHQWNGTQWQGVGSGGTGQLLSSGSISSLIGPPVLRFDSTNKPVVSYWIRASGQSFAGEVVTEKFDGTLWKALGPSGGAQVLPAAVGTTWYAMELAANDLPIVAMGNADGSCTASPANVTRYVDTPSAAWVGLGPNNGLLPAPATTGYSVLRAATLLIDTQGNPKIAAAVCGVATGGAINSGMESIRYDGTSWSASSVHTVNTTGYVFSYPALSEQFAALDPTGQVVAAWEEAASTNLGANRRYYLQLSNGTSWQGLGSVDGMVDGLIYPGVDVNTPYSELRMATDSQGKKAVAYVQDTSGTNSANTIGVSVYVP